MLGRKYALEEGVEQNYKVAAEWYRRAAEHIPDLGGAGQGRNELGLLPAGAWCSARLRTSLFWFSLDGPGRNAHEAKT